MSPQEWVWVYEAKVGKQPSARLSPEDVARYKAMLDEDEAKRNGTG
jgi:hypothetical protein